MVEAVGGMLLVAGIVPAVGAVWKRIMGPIDHLKRRQQDWSTEDVQMLAKYGYGNISQLAWVIVREISSHKADGCKPVLIGNVPFFKREVHLPQKGLGEYALLMKRPQANHRPAPSPGK